MEIYGDLKLVINQLLKDYEVKRYDLVPYFQFATHLLGKFDSVLLEHVHREDSRLTDAMTNLATTLALSEDEKIDILVCQRWVLPHLLDCTLEDVNLILVLATKVDDWRIPIIDYLKHGKLPKDLHHKIEIK